MPESLVTWIAAAVLLFWAVGAYNRLVRLRGDVNTAFGELDAALQKQVALVDGLVGADQPPQSIFEGAQPSFWGGLEGASAQLRAAAASARLKPLDRERVAALASAQGVLAAAWERAERDDAHDLAGPRLPATLIDDRAQLTLQCIAAAQRFTRAVEQYNHAIGQFPAVLLAWLFGFKAGSGMPGMPPPRSPAA